MISRRLRILTRSTALLLLAATAAACTAATDSPSIGKGASSLRAGVEGVVCAHYRKYASSSTATQFDDTEQCAPFGAELEPLYQFAQNEGIARDAYRWGHVDTIPVLSFDVRTEPWWTFDDDTSIIQLVGEQDRLITFVEAKAAVGPPDLGADRVNYSGSIGLSAEYDALRTAVERLAGQIRGVRRQGRVLSANVEAALAALRARVLGPNVNGAVRDAVSARTSAETLRRQLDTLLPAAAALPPAVRDSVRAFTSLRDRTPAANDVVRALVEQGSNAGLLEIASVEQSVRDWGARELADCETVASAAHSAGGEARSFASDLESAAPSLSALAAQGGQGLSLPSEVADAMDAMATWAELRRQNVLAIQDEVSSGLAERKEALIQAATDSATRGTLVRTRLAKASQLFVDEQTRRSEDLLRLPPSTKRLKAPLLAEKLEAAIAFAQLRATCEGDPVEATAWRYAGCQILVRNANRAETFRTSTVPLLLRLNAATLRRAGVAEASVQALERLVAAGAISEAAAMSDALLLGIDERQSIVVAPIASSPSSAPVVATASARSARPTSNTLRAERAASVTSSQSSQWEIGLSAVASLKQQRQQAIPMLRQALASHGGSIAHAEALRDAITEIDQVIASHPLSVGRADVEEVLNRHAAVDSDARERILAIWSDLSANLDALRTDGAAEMRTATVRAAAVRDATAAAYDAIATLSGGSAIAYERILLPSIRVPVVSNEGAIDDPGIYLGTFAQRVVSDLDGMIRGGVIVDRAKFLTTLNAFVRNADALGASIASRGATAPGELAALAAARARVATVVGPYVSETGWYADVAATAPLRAALDGAFGGVAGPESSVIKRALNTWAPASLSAEQRRVLDALDALRAAAADASVELTSPSNSASLRALLAAGAIAAAQRGSSTPEPFGHFCVAVTGNSSTVADPSTSRAERVTHALDVGINSPAFWSAVVSTGSDVGARVAAILTANPNLTASDLHDMVQRFGGPTIDGLAGATRQDIAVVAASIGDDAVRSLGASLSLADLRALDDLAFLTLRDASTRQSADRRGAVAKAMPSIVGMSASDLRTSLASRGFTLRTPGTTELWVHTDGSAVRIATAGSSEWPGVAHATRFVLGEGAGPIESNTLAAIHDVAGRLLPAWSEDANAGFATWFRATRAARVPTATETNALYALWLTRTRAKLAP